MTGEETKSARQLCLLNKKMKPKKSMVKNLNSKKDIKEIIVTVKKAAAEKRKEAHDTRTDEENTAAAAGAESTLVENAKQESEGKSTKHSSNGDSRSNTAAASEAGRATVETVTRESESGSKRHSSKDDSKSSTAAASEAGRTTVDTAAHEYVGENKKHGSDGERATAAASTNKSALIDLTLPETGSTVRSSEAAIPRGVSALFELRRPDGWTSTPRGEDDDETGSKAFATTGEEGAHDGNEPTGCSSSCDLRAGERLPKQRPLGEDHPECGQAPHLPAQKFLQVVEAGSIVLQSSHESSEIRGKDKSKQETSHNAAMKNDESVDKDAEIVRLIEERRKLPKEEKNRLKELSKKIKNCIREKKRVKRHHDIERILEEFQRSTNHSESQNSKEESPHHENQEHKR